MNKQYSIFRKFPTIELAKEIESLLTKNGIESVLADNTPPVDITFTGNSIHNEIEIRIKQSDFEKAESILENEAEKLIEVVDKSYYLFEFKDDELYEILLKPDEWNKFDLVLAKKLLSERGKPIDMSLIEALRKQRNDDLARPEKSQKYWIFVGYFTSIFGGFLGLIIGYFLWTHKKTLPNGQKVFSYSEIDRVHGKFIFFIGIVVFPIFFLLKIYY